MRVPGLQPPRCHQSERDPLAESMSSFPADQVELAVMLIFVVAKVIAADSGTSKAGSLQLSGSTENTSFVGGSGYYVILCP